MKNILGFIGVILLLSSCNIALFDGLPGKEQKSFPTKLQGDYYLKVPTSFFKKNNDKDTGFLEIRATSFVMKDSTERERKELDSDTKLSLVMDKYYVFAERDSDHKKYWNLTFIESTKKGAKFYTIIDEPGKSVLKNYFSRTLVQIAPEGGDSIYAYKTNEAQLVKYYEKVLKKKDALEVIRIKK